MPTTDLPPAPPDHALLARYAAERDEATFAELVARHGRLVYGACLRVLRSEADAADAFHATFLVLMRKAGTFRRGDNLPGWLHTVAARIALRARKRHAARHILEREAAVTADCSTARPDPQWVADLDEALAGPPRRPPAAARPVLPSGSLATAVAITISNGILGASCTWELPCHVAAKIRSAR